MSQEKILNYKNVIVNGHSVGYALEKLTEIPMTLDLLSSTDIAKVVNKLKLHEEYGSIAQKLVEKWKMMVMKMQKKKEKPSSSVKENSADSSGSRKRKFDEKALKNGQDAFSAMLIAANKIKQPVKPKKMKLPSVDEITSALQETHAVFDHLLPKSKQDVINSEELEPSQFKSQKSIGKVFAGRKKEVMIQGPVPTLQTLAINALKNNVDAIGLDYALHYMRTTKGLNVSYELLKPVLEACNEVQLAKIEEKNQHFECKSDELWHRLCHKKFPESKSDKYEKAWTGSWKLCFQQLTHKRDAKLDQIKKKISQQVKNTTAQKSQTRMINVMTPKNIRRKQEKLGLSTPAMRLPTAIEISKSRRQIFENGNKSAFHLLPKAVKNTVTLTSGGISNQSMKSTKGALMLKTMKMFKAGRR